MLTEKRTPDIKTAGSLVGYRAEALKNIPHMVNETAGAAREINFPASGRPPRARIADPRRSASSAAHRASAEETPQSIAELTSLAERLEESSGG